MLTINQANKQNHSHLTKMMLCVLSEAASLPEVVQSIFNVVSYADFLEVYMMWVSIMNVCTWNFCWNMDIHTPECVPPKFRWHPHVFSSHFIYFCLLIWGRLVLTVASFRLAGIMISKGVLFFCPLSLVGIAGLQPFILRFGFYVSSGKDFSTLLL